MQRTEDPQHEYLATWLGRWVGEGEIKAGPSGLGYKFDSVEEVEWLPGEFFLLMRWEYTTPNSDERGITVMGYDKRENAYFSHTFSSTGVANSFKGRIDGDTLTLMRTEPLVKDGQAIRSRFLWTRVSATVHHSTNEISVDGGPWKVIAQSRHIKTRSRSLNQ